MNYQLDSGLVQRIYHHLAGWVEGFMRLRNGIMFDTVRAIEQENVSYQ